MSALPTGATLEPLVRLLDAHPLPAADGDKDQRGTVVVIAGSDSCPGAAILTGVAALRAGAGRVQIFTAPEVAVAVGIAIPESLSVGWAGADDEQLLSRLEDADSVCIGPGLDREAPDIALAVLTHLDRNVPVLLDALAIPAAHAYAEAGQRFVIAPNVKEATELHPEPMLEQGVGPLAAALTSALHAPVAVRGETTVVAHGEAAWWAKGAVGLGTAGSGDVLAGVTAGMLARSLDPAAAVGWGVAVHARAGRELSGHRSNPGFLARELLDVIPDAIESLTT
ncbi:MAG TPA: NAD(P)H-hydrate dehydratase [Acidimicrobiales bacterium]|nr:NAD(P)H-hydrate dehydratase [Acidimicrobiales bacterium]